MCGLFRTPSDLPLLTEDSKRGYWMAYLHGEQAEPKQVIETDNLIQE